MVFNVFKFLFGFTLAIAILIGGGVATGIYFMNQSSRIPPKPIYPNDDPKLREQLAKTPLPKQTKLSDNSSNKNSEDKSEVKVTPTPTPTPTPISTEKPENEKKPLPPGAYQARVTWNQGLRLRSEPKADSQAVGGVGFNQKVIVIEESDDKTWQKVRLEDGSQEGWVKSRNTQKLDEQDEQTNEDNSQPNPR
ncbi:MAG: SH3 domain-containing protein [Methylacidiphilales bacterium]|nr:SH3 domain-containing protein [Candidatus Methylacidiphilales bacterium]NJR19693.1 SH3 domain-containing protein [Calothrix sp. CSU_2_0]